MSTSPNDDWISQLREAELKRLSELPDFPLDHPDDERGVLLSDRIEHYCQEYDLVSPFDPKNLRPAGYALRVGSHYSIGGKQMALSDGMSLLIEPYQVAIIETYETLNMPRYLIGRWNVQVKRAYDGLLWVGGAQVDPGFRGYLCCPIYNLSSHQVTLCFRDSIAVIDFVTTTSYRENKCLRFDWANRKMLVFQEYRHFKSGIEHEVDQFKQRIEKDKQETSNQLTKAAASTEESLRDIRSQIETFLTLIFTVVAVLFTGLGIVATTPVSVRSFLNLPVWVAAVALWFALRAFRRKDIPREKWSTRIGYVLMIILIIVLDSLVCRTWEARISQEAFENEQQAREAAFGELRQQSDARFDSLQQQINQLRPAQPAPE